MIWGYWRKSRRNARNRRGDERRNRRRRRKKMSVWAEMTYHQYHMVRFPSTNSTDADFYLFCSFLFSSLHLRRLHLHQLRANTQWNLMMVRKGSPKVRQYRILTETDKRLFVRERVRETRAFIFDFHISSPSMCETHFTTFVLFSVVVVAVVVYAHKLPFLLLSRCVLRPWMWIRFESNFYSISRKWFKPNVLQLMALLTRATLLFCIPYILLALFGDASVHTHTYLSGSRLCYMSLYIGLVFASCSMCTPFNFCADFGNINSNRNGVCTDGGIRTHRFHRFVATIRCARVRVFVYRVWPQSGKTIFARNKQWLLNQKRKEISNKHKSWTKIRSMGDDDCQTLIHLRMGTTMTPMDQCEVVSFHANRCRRTKRRRERDRVREWRMEIGTHEMSLK